MINANEARAMVEVAMELKRKEIEKKKEEWFKSIEKMVAERAADAYFTTNQFVIPEYLDYDAVVVLFEGVYGFEVSENVKYRKISLSWYK